MFIIFSGPGYLSVCACSGGGGAYASISLSS